MRTRTLLFALWVCSITTTAQVQRMMHWYFGQKAGIDFTSGEPVVVNDGELTSWESSATMSDLNGNLLFYTDGRWVWNMNHDTMPNGFMLQGDESALKGSVIAPKPADDNLYYIFTGRPLKYHVVDMSEENGLGDVILKNQPLMGGGSEGVAATLHCNKQDTWVLGRHYINPSMQNEVRNDSLNFYLYRLSENGISDPYIQKFHFDTLQKSHYDHPTFSPRGNMFTYSCTSSNIYLFDFDTYTGELTFRDSLIFNLQAGPYYDIVYSHEFSPDETRLYVTYWKKLIGWQYIAQYDLTADDINASKVILDSIPIPSGIQYGWSPLTRIQGAPDGKMYVTRYRSVGQYFVRDTLDVILYPNLLGLDATYQRDFLSTNGAPVTAGLPNFVSNYVLEDIGEPDCPGMTGVNDSYIYTTLKVYPNPAGDKVRVEWPGNSGNTRIEMYDATGRLCLAHRETMPSPEVDVSQLRPGIYTVQVFSEDELLGRTKLIKK